jgi:hypothetical protein
MGQLLGREPEMVRLHGFLVRLDGGPVAVVVEG